MRQPVPFGKYLLLDRISVGGMAEVFKAKSYGVEGFEKIIAIKRILPTMGEDRDFIKMFIDEAKIAGQLAHANICQIFELGRIDGSHFIAMEYIWGKDLLQIQNRLRKLKQPMPVPMACFTIAKVLEGLDYAHRKRDPLGRPLEIVHRDCSPQNVLVSYEGEVKVIDFGIAKATSRNSRTMAGVLKGKFGYMSPEQVRGLPLDRRSDIFALGTMLYECLTSERLFQGETDFSTLEKVRNVDIRPPRELNPAIPESVERVILKALAKDVDERYQWCNEMLADLQQYLMSQDVVFTAKSLSSWLKEVFQQEIERERQLLEQYKRVGRDGLINGVAAADANVNVVEALGEAPNPEGDATQLGGPNFDDIEQVVGAAAVPEVGPAPGSPAARGSNGRALSEGESDFGEEAPTEIFGEIDHGAIPTPQPGAIVAPARVPTSSQPPASRSKPPAVPAGRPTTQRPSDPAYAGAPPGYGNTPGPTPRPAAVAPTMTGDALGAYAPTPPGAGYPPPPMNPQQYGQQQPTYMPGYTPQSQPAMQGSAPPMSGLAQPNQGQGRTLMGAAAPPGLPNYANYVPGQTSPPQGYPQQPPSPPQGYPQQPSSPYGAQPQMMQHPSSPQMHPSSPQMGAMGAMQMHPSSPQMQQYNQGYPMMTQPSPMGGLSNPGYNPPQGYAAQPVDQGPVEGRRKSSIARDVFIGVAIAAIVLGGFLVVKFVILDDDSGSSSTSGSGSSAEVADGSSSKTTLKVELPSGVKGRLHIDGSDIATVENGTERPIAAGKHKLKIIAVPSNAQCEKELDLTSGKTTTLACKELTGGTPAPAPTPTPGPGSGSGSGSAGATPPPTNGALALLKLNLGTSTSVHVYVDDKEQKLDKDEVKVSPGSHKVKLVLDHGARQCDQELAFTSGKTTPFECPPKTPDKVADKTPDKTPDKAIDKTVPPPDKKPPDKLPLDKTPDKKPPDKLPPDKVPDKQNGIDNAIDKALDAPDKKPPDKKPPDKKPPPDKLPPEDTSKGYLQVYSKGAPAKIAVDNSDTGLTTPISGKALALPPGRHKVTYTIGGDKFTFTVTIKAGTTETLSKDLQ